VTFIQTNLQLHNLHSNYIIAITRIVSRWFTRNTHRAVSLKHAGNHWRRQELWEGSVRRTIFRNPDWLREIHLEIFLIEKCTRRKKRMGNVRVSWIWRHSPISWLADGGLGAKHRTGSQSRHSRDNFARVRCQCFLLRSLERFLASFIIVVISFAVVIVPEHRNLVEIVNWEHLDNDGITWIYKREHSQAPRGCIVTRKSVCLLFLRSFLGPKFFSLHTAFSLFFQIEHFIASFAT